MATPKNAPYKLAQRDAEEATRGRMIFCSVRTNGLGWKGYAATAGRTSKKGVRPATYHAQVHFHHPGF